MLSFVLVTFACLTTASLADRVAPHSPSSLTAVVPRSPRGYESSHLTRLYAASKVDQLVKRDLVLTLTHEASLCFAQSMAALESMLKHE